MAKNYAFLVSHVCGTILNSNSYKLTSRKYIFISFYLCLESYQPSNLYLILFSYWNCNLDEKRRLRVKYIFLSDSDLP